MSVLLKYSKAALNLVMWDYLKTRERQYDDKNFENIRNFDW